MSLKSLVKNLASFAKNSEVRAHEILGARPGPGFDLLIKPVEPMCGKWHVEGLTRAGVAFVDKFWQWQPLSNQRVAELRKQANDWGLTYQTKYQVLSISDFEGSVTKGEPRG